MPVNADKPHLWKTDIARSVDFYNDWFMSFAPEAYRTQRTEQAKRVEVEMERTDYLRDISPELLRTHPSALPLLRMATAPPLARDRLAGLAHVDRYLINSMEGARNHPPRVPPRMDEAELMEQLERISHVVEALIDQDLCHWIELDTEPLSEDVHRASLVLADRLCGAAADPIIRNAQEKRQLDTLRDWFERHGYRHITSDSFSIITEMPPGTFTFLHNVPVTTTTRSGKEKQVNITVDALVIPHNAAAKSLPIIIEAKSAGDFTNPNKRRKEEAQKAHQLRVEYGSDIRFVLFLCGYFDSGYLGYEAAEGIDWIWEHRPSDLAKLGLSNDHPNEDGGPSGNNDPEFPDAPITAEPSPQFGSQEKKRLDLQHHLDAQKTQAERNRMGQFATPYALAVDMARYAVTLLPDDEPIDFLEPALGTGVFFSALRRTVSEDRVRRATGFEIDPHYGTPAQTLWDDTCLAVALADFTKANPNAQPSFNLLLTNPPYTRHHHLTRADKERLRARSSRITGRTPSGLSGLYAYFVYLAHPWMREGGVEGWLIPTDFMYVNYGRQLREYLLTNVTLLRVHQFDPEDVQFDDALVSSTVLWFKKETPPSDHEVLFSYGGSLLASSQSRRVPVARLKQLSKWHNLFATPAERPDEGIVRLGDLFTVKRGIATGANKFFIMTPEEAQMRGLPETFLTPILPSPRHLSADVIEAEADGMPAIEQKLLLLNCPLPEHDVQTQYPALWRYLQEGVDQGINERYLCSKRSPWYLQEERDPAPLLCSYMGRSTAKKKAPFRFILNRSRAIAPNVYLNLYPKPHVQRAFEADPSLPRVVWEAIQQISTGTLLSNGRTYGGGLHKLEPGELVNAPLPGLPEDVVAGPTAQGELF